MRIKLLFRNLFRQKLNNIVIIVSLTIGLACVNLISTFIIRELNTDKFHKDYDRIYALKSDDPFSGKKVMYYCKNGSAEYIKENFSQVEDFCRVGHISAEKITANNNEFFDNPIIMIASKNFFSFFDYQLLNNTPDNLIKTENSLIISKELAEKYFGNTNPIGQNIILENQAKKEDLVVTGLFEKPEENTQLKFDIIRFSDKMDSRCYIKLTPESDYKTLENILHKNGDKIPSLFTGIPGKYYLEPFEKTYFETSRLSIIEACRDKNDLLIASIIGLIIIIVALFNYFGLLNISLLEKTKSFSIQRINGSSRLNIAMSVMLENILLFTTSVILSLFLVIWIAPLFNKLTSTNITPLLLLQSKQILILLTHVTFFLTITFLFILFRIKKVFNTKILKSNFNQTAKRIQLPAFNIFQLATSVVLIICSTVILKQIKYISDKPIGLNKDVIEVKIPEQYANKTSIIKEELQSYPFINQVSITQASPLQGHFMLLLQYNEEGKEKKYTPACFSGDENYISTLNIELIKGENFHPTQTTDDRPCIINESLANLFPGQNLIGKLLPGTKSDIVVGIAKDFNFTDLKRIIEPAYISYSAKGNHLLVEAKQGQSKQARELIEKAWGNNIPDYPLNIETIEERFEWKHRENQNYIRLIGSCSFISIFLSVIGLFVISLRSCQYRTKEIGVRKVNGAKTREILTMLNSDFIKWVVIAFVISAPVAWYAMNKWLENFAYKTNLSWWIFVFAGIISVAITLITVSWQSMRAANKNPVETLRYE